MYITLVLETHPVLQYAMYSMFMKMNIYFNLEKGFSEKPIVAFTNSTVFILYMTKPV